MLRLSDGVCPEAFVELVVREIEMELDGAGCEVSINEQGTYFELVGQEAADVGREGGGTDPAFDGQERVEVNAMDTG